MVDLVKIAVVFISLILLLRKKLNLGVVMLLGSLLLALLYLTPPRKYLDAVVTATLSRKSLEMTAALVFTMIMENILRTTGTLKKMVESLFELLPDPRIVMAAMPAVIGMLPSPGGAVFSAPMVKEASSHLDIPPDRKAFINYWYRHIWEYVSPLYPGIILTAAVAGLSVQQLALANAPFAVSVVLWGAFFGFAAVPGGRRDILAPLGKAKAVRTFVLGVAPIMLTLILVVFAGVNVALAMAGVTAALYTMHRYSPPAILRSLRESVSLKALFLVLGILIFQETLRVTGSLDIISATFAESGLPPLLIISIIPFLVGLMTGLTVAYVGITFPILLPLMGGATPSAGLLALAFGSGFAGVMLSPVHLCLVLTREYFNADLGLVYRRLLMPSALVLAAAVVPLMLF